MEGNLYSERDMIEINRRIRGNLLALIPVLAALAAVYVYALAAGVQWLAMAAGPLIFVAACYGFLACLWPNLRYRRFLLDMDQGLSREMRGSVVDIAGTAELQDGAMVLPVRIFLDDAGDERIVYLNASKRAMMPQPGVAVTLRCFGRHIRSVVAERA